MSIKSGLGIYTLVLLIAVASISYVNSSTGFDEYFNRVKSIVAKLERVSSEGLDTSRVEYYLNNALSLLSKGNLTNIEEEWVSGNLSLAEREVDSLISNVESHVFWRNTKLSLTIGLIASIPVLTYLFLPRIWAYTWFKTRKRWVVKKK